MLLLILVFNFDDESLGTSLNVKDFKSIIFEVSQFCWFVNVNVFIIVIFTIAAIFIFTGVAAIFIFSGVAAIFIFFGVASFFAILRVVKLASLGFRRISPQPNAIFIVKGAVHAFGETHFGEVEPLFFQVDMTNCSFCPSVWLLDAAQLSDSKSHFFTRAIGSSSIKGYWAVFEISIGEHLFNLGIVFSAFFELQDLKRLLIALSRPFLVLSSQFPRGLRAWWLDTQIVASQIKLAILSHNCKKGHFWCAAKTGAKINNFVSCLEVGEILRNVDFFEFMKSSLLNLAHHQFALFWVLSTEGKQVDQSGLVILNLVAFPARRQAIDKYLAFFSENHSEIIRMNDFLEVCAVCWLFDFSQPASILGSSQSFAHRKYLLILANKEHAVLVTDHLLSRRDHA